MKHIRILPSAFAALATLALAPAVFAQTSVTTTTTGAATVAPTTVVTTTTSAGRVGTVSPDMLVLQTASGTEPIPYSRTSRTVFVDETGAVVPEEALRSGVPITVHYSRNLDRMVAERVIVHRQVATAPGAAVIERTTTVAPTPVVPVQREVIVQERAPVRPPAVIEKKTTTTTTTGPAVTPAPVVVKEVENDDD